MHKIMHQAHARCPCTNIASSSLTLRIGVNLNCGQGRCASKLAVFPPRRKVPEGHMQGSFVISGQHAEYSLMCDALTDLSLVAAENPHSQYYKTRLLLARVGRPCIYQTYSCSSMYETDFCQYFRQ